MTSTATDRVRAALESARATQPRTNAFSRLFDETDGEASGGRLAGVPVAVKELFDVRGQPTTGCCAAVGAEPSATDAALVQRLHSEGAVVIGKTNMHELGAGVTNLESSCGPTRNPWDPSRMTGGSSGGSAAAVAVGVVPISLVSDSGGSARIPASFCGVWGMKVTHGRLSVDGMMPLVPELDCPGVIAGSLEALGDGVAALAGPAREPPPARVGVLRGGRWERCGEEVRHAVDAAAARLRARDIDVRDVDGSELDDVHRVWNRIAWPSFAERYEGLTADPALGFDVAAVIRWGREHRDERPGALARAERIGAWFADAFADLDLLLTATTPYVAPRIDASGVDLGDGESMDVRRGGPAWFTTAASVAGLPAISVPFAWTGASLPIGVQLIGPTGGEAAVLEGASRLEHAERPPLPEP